MFQLEDRGTQAYSLLKAVLCQVLATFLNGHWIHNAISYLTTKSKELTCDILFPVHVFTCKHVTIFQINDAVLFFSFQTIYSFLVKREINLKEMLVTHQ